MPLPPIAELTAASGWHAVDCISDLHLDAAHPATLQGLATYLGHTSADAVLILGDLFEVWVGDDAIAEPGSFEAEVCALLRQASRQRALYFMHGNRDFLVGEGFAQATGITLLTEESAAFWRGQGYSAAPIVTSPIGTWAGFRPDLLTKLKEHTA